MPYLRTFLPWNVIGGALWGAGCVLLGYGFSASLVTVGHYLTWGPLVLIGFALVGFVLARVIRRRRMVADHAPAPVATPDREACS